MNDDDLTIVAAIRDELSGPLDDIRSKLDATGRAAETAGRKAQTAGARGFDALANGAIRAGQAAGRLAVGALTKVATAAAVATGAAVTLGVKTAAQMQNASIAFTTMLGSAKKAGAFLDQLKQFAAKTPFEFPELQTAASSLISAGVEASKVIPIMTSLGNATSGMGTGSEGVKRATIALQQMNAAGRITGEDLNQLRDAGIPVFDLLAAATGKSKKEVAALAQAGKLGGKELAQLMKALETGKGLERFNGLMEKQSASLGGAWSTLSDTVQMGLANALQPAIQPLTDLTNGAAALAQKAAPSIATFLKQVVKLAPALAGAFRDGDSSGIAEVLDAMFGNTGQLIGPIQGLINVFLTQVLPVLRQVGTIIVGLVVPAFTQAQAALPAFQMGLSLAAAAIGWVANNMTIVRPLLTYLLIFLTTVKIGTMAWAAAQWLLNAAMTANPIGIVIVVIAALVAGIILAYQKSATFRAVVQLLWAKLQEGWAVFQRVATAVAMFILKWTPLGGLIRVVVNNWDAIKAAIASAIVQFLRIVVVIGNFLIKWNPVSMAINTVKAAWSGLSDTVATAVGWFRQAVEFGAKAVEAVQGFFGGGGGDTVTSRARGAGSAIAGHRAAVAASGASGVRVSNAWMGGGGRGRGSGDHQAGRALDLVGRGLTGYRDAIRGAGGFAEFHGSGPGRHLHAVPAGDTITPRRTSAPGSSMTLTVAPGAIVIQGSELSREELEAATVEALEAWLRDVTERGGQPWPS